MGASTDKRKHLLCLTGKSRRAGKGGNKEKGKIRRKKKRKKKKKNTSKAHSKRHADLGAGGKEKGGSETVLHKTKGGGRPLLRNQAPFSGIGKRKD